jgi:hypothetical protein
MTPLPRGECRSCHQLVPVRRNGAAREHRVVVRGVRFEAGRQVDDPPTLFETSAVCPGAGLLVIDDSGALDVGGDRRGAHL